MERNKKIISSLLSLIVFFSIFLPTSVFGSTENVRGFLEPFFIQDGEKEFIASEQMITINNEKYIPIQSITDALSYSLSFEDGILHIASSSQIEQPLIQELPKKFVSIPTKITFKTNVNAQGALIAENTADNIMFQKNGTTIFYPASTTKLLTALLAVERGNLTDIVTVTQEATQVPSDSTTAYLLPGDQLTLEQLLYAMLLPSGNDAAVAIAVHIAGSEANFAKLMNERAKQLGAYQTNFVNAHGYHHPNHYTTPQDMSKIVFEVIKHPELLKIIGTASYTAYYRNANGETVSRTWDTTNQMIKQSSSYYHPAIIGGKTGYTSAAGYNLVSIARQQNDIYVTIVFKGLGTERYNDTKIMLDRAIQLRTEYDQTYPKLQGVTFYNSQTFIADERVVSTPAVSYQGQVYVPASSLSQILNKQVSVSTDPLYKISIDKKLIPFTNVAPINESGRILVPFRQLFEEFNFEVNYDKVTKTIYATNDQYTIRLKANSTIAYVNEKAVLLDVPAKIVNGYTMVPVRFFAEMAGKEVDWGVGRTVILK